MTATPRLALSLRSSAAMVRSSPGELSSSQTRNTLAYIDARPATRRPAPGPSSLAPAPASIQYCEASDAGRICAGFRRMAAEIMRDAAQRRLVRRHHFEARHDHVEHAVARALLGSACRFRLGKNLGIDLALKRPEQVRLAGEVAAKIGKAEHRCGRQSPQTSRHPSRLRGEIERRPHGFVTLGEIVEHGGSPLHGT